MIKRVFLGACFAGLQLLATAQNNAAQKWVDSVYKTLSNDERIAQLMVVRLSTIDGKTKTITFFDGQVSQLIKKYNIGGVCLFQGSPVKQATILNNLQAQAKTPILVCIDAEWGVGMRMTDSVLPLPKQMMLGAMKDASIVYKYGALVAAQCRRIGIQVNYAPVVDVNNNPDNPVINDRSFGEDKYKVANFGVAYMNGMQDNGVMACAKHFPGHGDVAVDSHLDLPVINKSVAELDSLELYPFRKIFAAGVGSVMVAHLYIPSIDSTPNRATSLSPKNINGLMRNTLGYQGLTFTDALEMQGVKKFFPDGQASVQSIIAGNDMLCLPGDVPSSILKIKAAIDGKRLSWKDIEMHCKKVLLAKYNYGLATLQPINTANLTEDLNKAVPAMRQVVAENAVTLLAKKDSAFFPLSIAGNNKQNDVVYVAVGTTAMNAFATRMKADYNADVLFAKDPATVLAQVKKYKKVVIGVHGLGRSPATNFDLSPQEVGIVKQLQQAKNVITFLFGNAYAARNWCDAKNLILCYEDDSIIQNTAIDMLQAKLPYRGTLPVTVCSNFKYGAGFTGINGEGMAGTNTVGFNKLKLLKIDSIANDAIAKGATPGCVVLVAKDGRIAYNKAFGTSSYDGKERVIPETVYDLASVTKVLATTISLMRLYDEGKLDLKKKLGDYLPAVKGSDKETLSIENMLLHQAGLVPYIPFYKETNIFSPAIYDTIASDSFSVPVAKNMFMRTSYKDSMYKQIIQSQLGPAGKYEYSDNDFIFLGKVVEDLGGMPLDEYVQKRFYTPMSLGSMCFRPLQHVAASRIAPTENDTLFRHQILRGYVHDQGAAMFGGVSGHAGLFSDAYDAAAIMQMLMDGGMYNGKRFLQKSTVDLFTEYNSAVSRRGYGFDKPEKDNSTRKEPYPALSASPATFGHTGFTGTCVWADPAKGIVFVFLSNRIQPAVNNLLQDKNVRTKIFDIVYEALDKQ